MSNYLLSVYQPSGGEPPAPAELAEIMNNVAALNEDMRRAGVWVFSGGLHGTETATVLTRPDAGGDALVTDGPFLEGKEYLGGLTIVDVPDLDAALAWGRRCAEVTGLPIEVRPFVDAWEGN